MLPRHVLLAGLLLACWPASEHAAAQAPARGTTHARTPARGFPTSGTPVVVQDDRPSTAASVAGVPPLAVPSSSDDSAASLAEPRLNKGLLIAGTSVLSGSYAMALVFGFALMTTDPDDCTRCVEVGRPLLIPVVGPFLSADASDGERAIVATLGVVEVVGLALTIGGIVKYRNSKERARQQGYVVELDRGRHLTLDVATNPRLLGPQLKLSF